MKKLRLGKSDSFDIAFAMTCLGKAIDWCEFQAWSEKVIVENDIGDLPDYFFEIPMLDSASDLWADNKSVGVFGFVPNHDLRDDEITALYAIGYKRNLLALIAPNPALQIPSQVDANSALTNNPRVEIEYNRLFGFLGVHG